MGQHWLVIFEPNLLGKQRFLSQPTSIVEREQTKWPTAAPVTQWRTAYSATSSVARPQRPRSDLFPELHLFLSPIFLPLLTSPHHGSIKPPPFRCWGFLPQNLMLRFTWKSKGLKSHPSFSSLNGRRSIVLVCILFIVVSPWGLKML